MPSRSRHGGHCLLIIDMINDFTFDEADKLFPAIEHTAKNIALLKQQMKAAGFPVVYVNDNFGKWRSDFRNLVERCVEERCRGKLIARLLHPEQDDYFVLKPKHSGFFATPLELLLSFLQARRLVMTGVASNNCVLYTAADAYMREFDVAVPSDCVISVDRTANAAALEHMRDTLKADIAPSTDLIGKLAAQTR
jgi:nicotinamidase-related amidase